MSRVIYAAKLPPSWLAGLSSNLAFFSLALLLAALFLHRISLIPTPLALSIVVFVSAGALIALIMAGIAGLDVWVTGRQGAARIIVASAVSLALLAIPAAAWRLSQETPPINDITTDFQDPPPLATGPGARPSSANPATYPGEAFAAEQRQYYPDIRPIVVPRTVELTYDAVLQALAKLRYRHFEKVPPTEDNPDVGLVQFAETTPILGFTDDVAIRVAATETGARVDLRSASRHGQNDFGANTERLRTLMTAIVARLEATVPAFESDDEDDDDAAAGKRGERTLKSRKERSRERANRRQ